MTKKISQVFYHQQNQGDLALAYFQKKLSFETDIADLAYDYKHSLVDYLIIDVRSHEDYLKAHLPHAISLPGGRFSTFTELQKEIPIVVYCWGPACNGATKAALRLSQKGYVVKELIGGIEYWRKEGGILEGSLQAESPLYWNMDTTDS